MPPGFFTTSHLSPAILLLLGSLKLAKIPPPQSHAYSASSAGRLSLASSAGDSLLILRYHFQCHLFRETYLTLQMGQLTLLYAGLSKQSKMFLSKLYSTQVL